VAASTFYFDPHAEGLAVFMGPTEARLMALAWKHRALTVKKALHLLADQPPPAYTTVMTTLTRLTKKGLLKRQKDGRTYVYRPCLDRESFLNDRLGLVTSCLTRNFRH
jgi:predicted transcriptional regulator